MCPYELGIFPHCIELKLGLLAMQDGEFTFHITSNGYEVQHKANFFAFDELLLPAAVLNEVSTNYLTIINPDGTVYSGYNLSAVPINETYFMFRIENTQII